MSSDATICAVKGVGSSSSTDTLFFFSRVHLQREDMCSLRSFQGFEGGIETWLVM
jgi:hypothetical protein